MVTVSKLGKMLMYSMTWSWSWMNQCCIRCVGPDCMILVGQNNEVIIHYECYDVLEVQTDIVRIALYSIVLYCIVLYCIVLHRIVLYWTILYCIVLNCIVWSSFVLYSIGYRILLVCSAQCWLADGNHYFIHVIYDVLSYI